MGWLGIPQCISPLPAAMAESKSFKVQASKYILQKMVAVYCGLRRGRSCEAPRALTAWKEHLWSLLLQSACFRGRRVFALCMVAVIFIRCCCQAPLSFLHRQHKLLRSDCVLAFPPLPPSICSILSLSSMPYGDGVGSSINCYYLSFLVQLWVGGGWGWVGGGWRRGDDSKGPAACCH